MLGLRGWPAAAEEAAVARDLAVLARRLRDVPGARLHLTHLSTAAALDLVRRAKAAGLPVTCDVTPHHLALTDEWVAGARRWAWEAAGDPWADGALVGRPFASTLRVNPPLRSPDDAAACMAAVLDGTADAIATDHAPHTDVDKAVEFGAAANGISGIETALGVLLAAVDAGRLPLLRAVEALTTGPAGVLGDRSRRDGAGGPRRGCTGRPRRVRSLRALDRDARRRSLSRGRTARCSGCRSPGRVLADDGRRTGRLRGARRLDRSAGVLGRSVLLCRTWNVSV